MSAKFAGDDISEMLEACIDWASNRGKDDKFFVSLQEWYEEKGFLTERQYESLSEWYDKVTF